MADEATKQKLRSTFDKLTPEDFASVAGNKDGLADKVAEKYGISKDEATKQVTEAFSNTSSTFLSQLPRVTSHYTIPTGERKKSIGFCSIQVFVRRNADGIVHSEGVINIADRLR
ncbi:hypothetical protein LTR93_000427 [Exophiala xenobiotica]|nr:hypothetical protein LTR93_000427 [Exophiala xenobiotica]